METKKKTRIFLKFILHYYATRIFWILVRALDGHQKYSDLALI